MFVYLVLYMRHYTLKRIVVLAEDVEKAGVPGEPDQGNGEHSEERASEPSNDNGDDDIKTMIDVDEKRTPSL
jgi:hypothetical protein